MAGQNGMVFPTSFGGQVKRTEWQVCAADPDSGTLEKGAIGGHRGPLGPG